MFFSVSYRSSISHASDQYVLSDDREKKYQSLCLTDRSASNRHLTMGLTKILQADQVIRLVILDGNPSGGELYYQIGDEGYIKFHSSPIKCQYLVCLFSKNQRDSN